MATNPTARTGTPGQSNADLTERAKDAAASIGEKAQDTASAVAKRAEDAVSYVGKKADHATDAVGGSLKSLGHSIREHTPDSGTLGNASSAVAERLEHAGRYLEEEGFQGIGEDLVKLIRRNPIPALLVGIGIGCLLGRAMRSSRCD